MIIEELEKKFNEMAEVEVMRLLTCGFNEATFSLIKDKLPKTISEIGELAIKHSYLLSSDKTSLVELSDKLTMLEIADNTIVNTNAIRLLGYSGKLLSKSETFISTADNLVSYNEQTYYLNLYPWPVEPVNPEFKQFKNSKDKGFYYTKEFDLSILERLKDVEGIKKSKLYLKNGIAIKLTEV